MKNRAASALVALLASACGGGGSRPTGPTVAPAAPPAPQVLTVVSGETRQPVAGARLNVGGRELTTDAAGQASIDGGLAASTPVDVRADGYLDRQTLLSRAAGGAPYSLWPRNSATGLDEHTTGELVYTSSNVAVDDPPFGEESLRRWGAGPVEVVLQGPGTDPGYRDFTPGALSVQAEAVAAINQALGGRLVLPAPVYRDGAPAADRILVRVFPEYSSCVEFDSAALATLAGPLIRQVTITFCDSRWSSDLGVATHELGHAVGLRHSSDPRDIMHPGRRRTLAPSARERLLLGLMHQRLPGNRFPDNDRSASTASDRPVEFRCR